MKKILFLIFLGISSNAFTQTLFTPGYVIMLNNDTIWGEINYRGDAKMSSVCTFRKSAKETPTNYSPGDIQAFRFTEGKYYISKAINGQLYFLEYLIKGRVSVYYMRDKTYADRYFIDKEGEPLRELRYSEENISKDGTVYRQESRQHIGLLHYYMNDAPQLFSEINLIKTLKHKDLISIAKKYNDAVCDEECVVYKKELPPLKIALEVNGGYLFKIGDNTHNNSYQYSILGHLWMPRLNESIYFKTGLIYLRTLLPRNSTTPVNSELQQNFYVPMGFEYLSPKGMVRPKASIGIIIPTAVFRVSVGGNVKLTNLIYISLNFDNYLGMPTAPENGYNSSALSGGIYFKF